MGDLIEFPGEKLLRALDQDPDRAGEKLNAVVARLTRYFEHNNCRDPADLAQEVLVRVTAKLGGGMEITALKVESLLFAFADNIRREHWKSRKRERTLADLQPKRRTFANRLEPVEAAILLQECERILGPADMKLLTRYYLEGTEALSRAIGTRPSNLVLKIHRLKQKLRLLMNRRPRPVDEM
jgi:DNA-directed RNA polymerase specialized sigma24 family protein